MAAQNIIRLVADPVILQIPLVRFFAKWRVVHREDYLFIRIQRILIKFPILLANSAIRAGIGEIAVQNNNPDIVEVHKIICLFMQIFLRFGCVVVSFCPNYRYPAFSGSFRQCLCLFCLSFVRVVSQNYASVHVVRFRLPQGLFEILISVFRIDYVRVAWFSRSRSVVNIGNEAKLLRPDRKRQACCQQHSDCHDFPHAFIIDQTGLIMKPRRPQASAGCFYWTKRRICSKLTKNHRKEVRSLKIKNIFGNPLLFCIIFLILLSSIRLESWPPKEKFYPELDADSHSVIAPDEYDDFPFLRPFWKAFVSDWFGKIVANHVFAMHASGCFQKLCQDDLDHGHLLLRKDAKRAYDSADEFLRDVVFVLYHCAEHTKRWRKERARELPVLNRIPRSLLGFKNGEVRVARNVINLDSFVERMYEESGTIHTPQLEDNLNLFKGNNSLKVTINGKVCVPSLDFSIKPYSKGRYKVGNQRLDVYVRYREEKSSSEKSNLKK